MGQNSANLKKCRGRPQIRPDEETVSLIIQAAAAEFQANGFAAATMGNVAQRAGISTKTMYRLIPNKADLFKHVMSERIGRFMLEADAEIQDTQDLVTSLEHMLVAFGSLTLEKEAINLIRLVIAESDRFPELAATFHNVAVVQSSEALLRWLKRQCQRGLVKVDDPVQAISALRGMMTMELQRSAMLGLAEVPTPEIIKSRAKFCARLFLDGCRVDQRGQL